MKKRNIRKTAAALTALALCAGVLTGCGGAAPALLPLLPPVLPPAARLPAQTLTSLPHRTWQI